MTANSFAPVPLGQGWTPPPDRATAAAGADQPEASDAPALGDLFAAAGPADGGAGDTTGDDPDDAPAQTGTGAPALGDLFAHDIADTPAPDAGAPVDSAAGAGSSVTGDPVQEPAVVLADLFPGTATVPPLPDVEQPHTRTPPAAPAPRPRARRRNETRVTATAPAFGTDAATGAIPAAVPADAPEATAPAPRPLIPTSAVRPAPIPAPAAPEAPPTVPPAVQPVVRKPDQPTVSRNRRSVHDDERLWNLTDQALAVVSGDPQLQRVAAHLKLTRDADEFTAQRNELAGALRPKMANAGVAIASASDIEPLIDRVHDELTGISVLGDLWRDPSVDEILVDRWDVVSVERGGRLERTDLRFRNPVHAEATARALALKISDRAVSRSIPLVTAELPQARITFAFGAVVKGGLSITIRKFRDLLTLDDLLAFGSLNEEMVEFLRDAVTARASILVSGGTGTGKTTIINLLSSFIPDSERVVTIEDAFELTLSNTHVVSLQTKEASSLDDTVSVTLADLLRNTLRMRPDRIIVGEIREGEGALVMLAAAATGHDGTITTIHANSPDSALNERLPDLVRSERAGRDDNAILRSVAAAFDLVIQITRSRSGRRHISQIAAVTGAAGGRVTLAPIFTAHPAGDQVTFTRSPLPAGTDLAERLTALGRDRWTS